MNSSFEIEIARTSWPRDMTGRESRDNGKQIASGARRVIFLNDDRRNISLPTSVVWNIQLARLPHDVDYSRILLFI